MRPLRLTLVGLMLMVATVARAQDLPALRVAVLKFGTVNWLTDTIQTHGLDRAEGFRLETVALAGRDATSVAFQAGDVDLIVADWIWVMNQRQRGADMRFFPYSTALGSMMVMPQTGVKTLCDLRGRTVGVVGGDLDKSWIVYQALAQRDCGFSLREETEAVFGAPPLMSRQLTTGAVAAVSTFWHFAARLEAEGAATLTSASDAIGALGIAPAPALVGFVWDAARSDPATVAAMGRAVRAAGALMAADEAEWLRLRPLMQAEDDAAFAALRDAYRAGVVTQAWSAADTEAARALHATLIAAGGEGFGRIAGAFDADAFAQ